MLARFLCATRIISTSSTESRGRLRERPVRSRLFQAFGPCDLSCRLARPASRIPNTLLSDRTRAPFLGGLGWNIPSQQSKPGTGPATAEKHQTSCRERCRLGITRRPRFVCHPPCFFPHQNDCSAKRPRLPDVETSGKAHAGLWLATSVGAFCDNGLRL